MGFFSNIPEHEEPSTRGLIARLKGIRSNFADSTSGGAMPIVGPAEPRFGTEQARERISDEGQPMDPHHTTLLGRHRGEDVTDIEVYEERVVDPDHEIEPTHEPITPAVQNIAASPAITPEAEPCDLADVNAAANPLGDRTGAEKEPSPVGRLPASEAVAQEPPSTALVESELTIEAFGRARLMSVDSLPPFKRILCQGTTDAALRITAAARREFVAVDLQAGVAIVVATQSFHETALYATYIKDLARADIVVREQMVATEDVIAAIYSAEKTRTSVVRESSRAIGVFRDVIEAAHAFGASDAHWEYRDSRDDVELRFRVNGDLYTYRNMPKDLVRRSLSAAYQDLVQRNTNSGETFQPSAPQSAMIPLVAHKDMLNLRWYSAPLADGFDVALRLLDGNYANYKVRLPENMGLEASQLEILESLGHVSGGVTILTGETGSAKTTLLRALSYLMAARDLRKQYAINEPSEYPQPWLSDISIPRRPDETDEQANRKCAEVIRTIMRMDPDDITVGEIRDAVVAGLVAELALTGHPVRTSLHADSAIGAFMRLAGGRLQLPMDEVSSEKFVNAVGNQKLIPLLCPHCKIPAADVMAEVQLELLRTKFGLDTSRMACRDENGCEHCRLNGLFTRAGKVAAGTKGQTLAMELFRPTPEFLDRVAVRDWRGAEKVWRGWRVSGFGEADMTGKTIYEHALYKAAQGIIDPRFIDVSMRPFAQYSVFADRDGRMPS